MNIYFIGQKGIPAKGGGIEKYAEDLSVEMAKAGHQVFVYTRPYYTNKNLKKYKNVNLISLPSIQTKHLDAITHSFLASLDVLRRKADIVYYQNIGPALVCWLPKLFSNIKIVSILQSQDYKHKKWGAVARFCLKFGEWVMCKFSDKIIVVTKLMKVYVKEKYNREAEVIPNGSNIKRILKAKEISKWGLEKDNYIVSISRLIRHKGVHYLIDAYNRLKTDKKLVIVGDGSYSDDYVFQLYELAKNNPNIIFTGNQTGRILAELYSNCFLFVQPSESEGMSLALLEAMSYERAVLASDIVENREALGADGFYFESSNTDDLYSKLAFLVAHKKVVQKSGQTNKERVKVCFNWEDIAKKIEYLCSKNNRDNNLLILKNKIFIN